MKKNILFLLIFLFLPANIFSQKANINKHALREVSDSLRYNISISYPQVDFGPDALMGVRGIAQELNSNIDTLTHNRINDFMYELKGLPKEPCAQQVSSLEVTYQTMYSDNSTFSFLFETLSAPDCSNHPYTYRTSLNFSAISTGTFGISDIFLPGTNWLKYVSDHCIKELKTKALKSDLNNIDEMITEGASQNADNFRVFNIDDKSITITFNPYKVGPYVWGIQTVTIPIAGMKDMIDPEGPVGFTVK